MVEIYLNNISKLAEEKQNILNRLKEIRFCLIACKAEDLTERCRGLIDQALLIADEVINQNPDTEEKSSGC